MTEHDEKHLKVYEAVYGNVLSTEQIQQLHNFTKDLGISADQEDGPKQQADGGARLQLNVAELYRTRNELVSAHTDLLVSAASQHQEDDGRVHAAALHLPCQ